MIRIIMSVHGFALALLVLLVLSFSSVRGQVSGISTLSVLDMPISAREASLGMPCIALYGPDINSGIANPSLISSQYSNMLSLNYVGMFGGTSFGSLSYGLPQGKVGSWVLGLRFMSYGRFQGYDEYDNYTGDFSAADYVFYAGWGLSIDSNYSIGASLSPVLSHYSEYTALAFAVSLAGTYVSDSRRFAASVVARNIGRQLLTFDGTTEPIPFDLGAFMSYKLENAPFRLYAGATDLHRWQLRYEDPLNPSTTTDMFGETHTVSPSARFFDNLFRHLLVGVEFAMGQNFFARLGYSYRQAREVKSVTLESFNTSGFSYGIGFRIKDFEFAYSRNNYHLGQAPNYISITTNLDRFFR